LTAAAASANLLSSKAKLDFSFYFVSNGTLFRQGVADAAYGFEVLFTFRLPV
jgi:hypothetical protein